LVACDGVFFLPRCYVLAGGDLHRFSV
jgi:hypothetical protein